MDVDKWIGSITPYEAVQIWTRFSETCEPSRVVLWSGIDFDKAQAWAARHGRKTLTLAMGPLMDHEHQCCRYNLKNYDQWCRYVHAASILLTLYASNGTEVVVLTPHPPQRLNPYRESYYQNIEEPWLTACCDAANFQIQFAHPDIEEAEDDMYQYWPVDRVDGWRTKYPGAKAAYHWRHHAWDREQMSHYTPDDLRRERYNIMQKMYLYRTGASIYWRVVVPANTTGFTPEEMQQLRRDERRRFRHESLALKLAQKGGDKSDETPGAYAVKVLKQQANTEREEPTKSKIAEDSQRRTEANQKRKENKKKKRRNEENKRGREEQADKKMAKEAQNQHPEPTVATKTQVTSHRKNERQLGKTTGGVSKRTKPKQRAKQAQAAIETKETTAGQKRACAAAAKPTAAEQRRAARAKKERREENKRIAEKQRREAAARKQRRAEKHQRLLEKQRRAKEEKRARKPCQAAQEKAAKTTS